jgi:Concanavalin A-like lectin/glucanases superfamily
LFHFALDGKPLSYHNLKLEFNPQVKLRGKRERESKLKSTTPFACLLVMIGFALSPLVVNRAEGQDCDPAPTNIVSWWPANDTTTDVVGTNNAILENTAGYGAGIVGDGFELNGNSGYVRVPASQSLDVGQGGGLTIEGWINPTNGTTQMAVAEYDGGGNVGLHFWISLSLPSGNGPGCLYANLRDTSGDDNPVVSPAGLVAGGAWQHIALTYDQPSGTATIYLNGVQEVQSVIGSITPQTSYDLLFGGRTAFGGVSDPFSGGIDEMSLYSRALSSDEIAAIYNAGAAGKCYVAPPFIASQPTNQSIGLHSNATFVVAAGGSLPLSFQWFLDSTNPIPGATNASLTISNVQSAQQGSSYSVLVTNAYGSVTSSNAVLNVILPPALIEIASTNAIAGGPVSVGVLIIANGNENAMGFSLNFDTTKLTYTGATTGSGAPGAVLDVNTIHTNSGELGLSLSLPPNATFAAGTQQVLFVNFASTINTNASVTTISFGSQPTPLQLYDAQLNVLLGDYANGSVSLAAAVGYEGDVYPRPNGDRIVTLGDLLLIGRYVARLEYPTNASEYQRADCAPRATLGNGAITVADWVQLGRYAQGLDPLTDAGGPTNDIPYVGAGSSTNRLITLVGTAISQGQTGTVSITLAAQGNENALGLSLNFNPAQLAFVSAATGSDAGNATLYVNTNQAGAGQLGFAMALGTGNQFSIGNLEMLKISFRAIASGFGNQGLSFGDQPVQREIADEFANALPASYVNAVIAEGSPPFLGIALSGQNIQLSWPLWASNFQLQAASGALRSPVVWTNVSANPGIINSQNVISLPRSGKGNYYRLEYP